MAKIWIAYASEKAICSEVIIEKPLGWCIEHLGLAPHDWKCILPNFPIVPAEGCNPDVRNRPLAVVVVVDRYEAIRSAGWKCGCYMLAGQVERVKKVLELFHKAKTAAQNREREETRFL